MNRAAATPPLFFKFMPMVKRNESLDALRGFAILTMILSGAIAFGDVLPAWMFHAQVPPPDHKFNPAIPGITWVDLVFPFFLFSMGAAIPLSLKKHVENNKSVWFVAKLAGKRFLLLAFFALFTQHMKAWVLAENPGVAEQLLSILAFVLLFFQFYEYKKEKWKVFFKMARLLSFALALFLLWNLPFRSREGFDFYKSDIIILVLANMAFFGTLLYYITARQPLWRIALLPFVMAILLAAKEPADGWAKAIFQFDHIGSLRFDWLYKFYFLKYLFIIIPGTLAGEMLLKQQQVPETLKPARPTETLLAVIAFSLVLVNLYGLFARVMLLNLIISVLLCAAAIYLLKKQGNTNLYRQFALAGSYCLLLGLFFEAYEGGIRKDSSTYSYYFVTSGLAFYTLLLFSIMAKRKGLAGISHYLSLNGKNPMLAYVAGNLLLLPILTLTQTKVYWDAMNQNFLMGLLKGVLFTGLVSLLTVFCVRKGWFWKT